MFKKIFSAFCCAPCKKRIEYLEKELVFWKEKALNLHKPNHLK